MARRPQLRHNLLLATLLASTAHAQVVPTLVERKDYAVTQPPAVTDTAYAPPGGFSAEINGTQDFTYDSNPLRVSTGEQSIYGSTTSPELVLRDKTATSLVQSTSRIDANAYNRSEFDSVDMHENLLMSHNNERWTASLTTLFDRDTTRESELDNYGSVKPRVYSNRIEAAPSLIFQQNDRDKWELLGSVMHDDYSDNSYTDYNFYTLAPTYEHQFDAQNSGRISLNAQRYETTSGADSSANSFGPSVGWTNKFSDRLTLHADAGAVTTDRQGTAALNTDSSQWDYVFSGGIAYKGTQNTLDITATRAQEPFGNGTETLLNSFKVNGTHNINEKLALSGTADYRKADYSEAQTGINLSHEYSVGGGIAYKILQEASLTADYTYHNEDLLNEPGTVNEHIVMLGIAFHPSWSVK